jgi:hypothetical protein
MPEKKEGQKAEKKKKKGKYQDLGSVTYPSS